jgi:hypothetical protein
MADTWNANTGSQANTGNAIRDGATASGLYTISTTIPTELNKKLLTISDLATYTNILTSSLEGTSNQVPTKDEIIVACS